MDTAVSRPELLLVADAVAREKQIERDDVLEAMIGPDGVEWHDHNMVTGANESHFRESGRPKCAAAFTPTPNAPITPLNQNPFS